MDRLFLTCPDTMHDWMMMMMAIKMTTVAKFNRRQTNTYLDWCTCDKMIPSARRTLRLDDCAPLTSSEVLFSTEIFLLTTGSGGSHNGRRCHQVFTAASVLSVPDVDKKVVWEATGSGRLAQAEEQPAYTHICVLPQCPSSQQRPQTFCRAGSSRMRPGSMASKEQ